MQKQKVNIYYKTGMYLQEKLFVKYSRPNRDSVMGIIIVSI